MLRIDRNRRLTPTIAERANLRAQERASQLDRWPKGEVGKLGQAEISGAGHSHHRLAWGSRMEPMAGMWASTSR